MDYRYAIVTPVKDEDKYLEKTAASVLSQDIRPQTWIIIDDRSRDRTGEIIQKLSRENPWIIGVRNEEDNNERRVGGEAVVHLGLNMLKAGSYDFLVRMDGDVSFDASYFSSLFGEFERNPRLGIASGVCYVPKGEKLAEEKEPRFHTRGPVKTYRVTCFLDIGGLDSHEGWDTIDEVKAHMLGWHTRNFPHLKIIHHRKTQTALGTLRGKLNQGRVAYYVGYHPLYAMLRAFRRMMETPYILGGLYDLAGFLEGYMRGLSRVGDPALVMYMRQQQMNRLLGRETIWK